MDAFQGDEQVHLLFERFHNGEGVEGLWLGFGRSDLLFGSVNIVFNDWR